MTSQDAAIANTYFANFAKSGTPDEPRLPTGRPTTLLLLKLGN